MRDDPVSEGFGDRADRHRLTPMGDEERGQLAAARWGITTTLVAWSVGFLVIVLDDDAEAAALGSAGASAATEMTLLGGSVACLALAGFLWFDSSPQRVEARRRHLHTRLSAVERTHVEPIA